MEQAVRAILADTEDVWNLLFRQAGRNYRKPKLVLYTDAVQYACGCSSAATGLFYCPGDEKVYIELDFLQEMQRRFEVPGDFAVVYVIAHESGASRSKSAGHKRPRHGDAKTCEPSRI